MKNSKSEALLSGTTWHGWLRTLQRWLEAMDFSHSDHLERRIESLEIKIFELQSKPGIVGNTCHRAPPDAE